jgi:hypothetical protein
MLNNEKYVYKLSVKKIKVSERNFSRLFQLKSNVENVNANELSLEVCSGKRVKELYVEIIK